MIKKYNELAKEAQSNGDHVNAEVFRQYAEHYRKIVTEINEKRSQTALPRNQRCNRNEDTDFSLSDSIENTDTDIVLEEVEWQNIPSKYIIDSCDTTLYYNDEYDVAEYNGVLFDVTGYKEELNEIINETVGSEGRPRLYKVDDNYSTTNLEPIYFSEQDASDLLAYWQQDPKTISGSFFTVNGRYHLVIGNDIVLLDNTLGVGKYNENKIEISDSVMDILDNYI